MATVMEQANPIASLLGRYKKRRGISVSELSRRTGRSRAAVRNCLDGSFVGLKSWHGDRLFWLLVEQLEIPEREARRAIADHFQNYSKSQSSLRQLVTKHAATLRAA